MTRWRASRRWRPSRPIWTGSSNAVPVRPERAAARRTRRPRWREKDARYESAVRLVNARAWAEYFGGLAIASHDAAARYAEKRDEALAILRELETDKGGNAA